VVWKPWLSRLILISALANLACTESPEIIDAAATDPIAPEPDLETTVSQPAHVVADPSDPFVVFGLGRATNDASATVRTTPVWLVNVSAGLMVVWGAGGAERVVVDTIAAADSVLVRIETRADTVVLEALTAGRVSLGTVSVSMDSELKRVAFPQ
jgi:hypothetical protein